MKLVRRSDQNGKLTRSYRKWSSMLQRCYNPKHPAYPYYGAKGIQVCDRWRGKDGYDNFFLDLGEPPPNLTLERIDRTQHYSPTNCRWATWKEQAANRAPTGKAPDPNSLRQKAIKANLPYHVVYQRIKIAFWPEHIALSTPIIPLCERAKYRHIVHGS